MVSLGILVPWLFFNNAWQITESDGTKTIFRDDGRIDSFQDAIGNRISAVYTAGRLARIIHSAGQYFDISYNSAGLIDSVTDPAGGVTAYKYDPDFTYLRSVVTPDSTATSYSYEEIGTKQKVGALLTITSASVTQSFTYDDFGRVASIGTTESSASIAQSFADGDSEIRVDSNNAIAVTSDVTTYTYDAGRVRIATPMGTTSLFFDARGLVTRVQDRFGNLSNSSGADFRINELIQIGNTLSVTSKKNGNATVVDLAAGTVQSISVNRGGTPAVVNDRYVPSSTRG